ncbi:MAG: MFS transporter [Bacillota bacterium]
MASLFILGFMEFVRGALVLSVIPLYGRHVTGLGLGVIGAAISLHYLLDNIFRLPAGWLTDRYGPKRLLSAGIIISSAGVAIIYYHWSPVSFVLGAGLFGLGISPAWPAAMSAVTSRVPAQQAGEALSKVFIAWLAGTGLGPLIINFIIDRSYNIVFLVLSGAMAAGLLFTVSAKLPPATGTGKVNSLDFLKGLTRNLLSLKIIYPGMFVQTMSIGILMPVLTIYALKVFGLSAEQLNFVLLGGGGFTVLLLIPVGKIIDRLGIKGPLVGGFLLAAISLFLLPLQSLITGALTTGAILGIAYAFILPAWNGLMARAVDPEKRGSMWAVFMTIEGLGTATGSLLGGKMGDVFGYRAPFFASSVILFSMAVFYASGRLGRLITAVNR